MTQSASGATAPVGDNAHNSDRWTRQVPQLAAALLGSLLVAQAVRAARMILLPMAGIPAPVVAASPMKEAADVAKIVAANLFGETPHAEAAASSLPMVLLGTFSMSDATRGLAIMAPAGGEARVYAVGSLPAAGAKLLGVYADHVLLERAGVVETLRMQPRSLRDVLRADVGQVAAVAAAKEAVVAAMKSSPPRGSESMIAGLAQFKPEMRNKQQVGYRLSVGSNPLLYRRLGLGAGDLLLAINGIALTDPKRSQEILNDLEREYAVVATIQRGSKVKDVTLNIANSLADAQRMATDVPITAGVANPQTGPIRYKMSAYNN